MHRSNPPNRLTHKDKAPERRGTKDEGHTEYMSVETRRDVKQIESHFFAKTNFYM